MTFYVITAAENAACLAIFLRFSHEHSNDEWLHTAAPIMIVAGSLLGHISQLVYYRWFHPAGPIKLGFSASHPTPEAAVEDGPSLPPTLPPTGTRRTLKHMNPLHQFSGVRLVASNVSRELFIDFFLGFQSSVVAAGTNGNDSWFGTRGEQARYCQQ